MDKGYECAAASEQAAWSKIAFQRIRQKPNDCLFKKTKQNKCSRKESLQEQVKLSL